MLQNMGNARGIGGRRAKAHAKAFVFVGIADGKQLRPGDIVLIDRDQAAADKGKGKTAFFA